MKFDSTAKAGLYVVLVNVIIGVFLMTTMDNIDTAFLLTLISGFIGIYLNIYFLRTNKYNRSINIYALVLNLVIISIFMIVKIYINQFL